MDFNTALATLEKNSKSSEQFIAELATRLHTIMPSLTEVVTKRSLFGTQDKIIALIVNLDDRVYRAELAHGKQLKTYVDKVVRGVRLKSEELNIVDSAAVPNLRGSYKYDDEGTPSTKTYLIREGKLVGRLHSRETAAKMNEEPTGNARAINYRHPPIVRMTNTFIEPQSTSFDDIISDSNSTSVDITQGDAGFGYTEGVAGYGITIDINSAIDIIHGYSRRAVS